MHYTTTYYGLDVDSTPRRAARSSPQGLVDDHLIGLCAVNRRPPRPQCCTRAFDSARGHLRVQFSLDVRKRHFGLIRSRLVVWNTYASFGYRPRRRNRGSHRAY